jgi:hypothetical protein
MLTLPGSTGSWITERSAGRRPGAEPQPAPAPVPLRRVLSLRTNGVLAGFGGLSRAALSSISLIARSCGLS